MLMKIGREVEDDANDENCSSNLYALILYNYLDFLDYEKVVQQRLKKYLQFI